MKIVFVAGPFRGDGRVETKKKNVEVARKFVRLFIEQEIPFYSPHLNIDQENITLNLENGEFAEEMNAEILKRCDALAVLPDWENSQGTKNEIIHAKENSKPVFYLAEKESISKIKEWLKKDCLLDL